jgi:hypothetical protein
LPEELLLQISEFAANSLLYQWDCEDVSQMIRIRQMSFQEFLNKRKDMEYQNRVLIPTLFATAFALARRARRVWEIKHMRNEEDS